MMITNPEWCIESNAWLRFDMEADGSIVPKMAPINEENSFLTMPWQIITPSTWHVFDKQADPGFQHRYYCLTNGSLYRDDGINKISQRPIISKYSTENSEWGPERGRLNPFESYDKSIIELAPGVQLPLTPEEQNTTWTDLQKKNLRATLLAQVESEFTTEQRDELESFLPPGLDARDYPDHSSHLAALREAICNTDNEHHIQLLNTAARTRDYETLQNSPIDIGILFQMKKKFFFDLLTSIYNHIREQFGLPAEELTQPDVITAAPIQAIDINEPVHVNAEPALIINRPGLLTEWIAGKVESPFDINERQDLLNSLEICLESIFTDHFDNLETYYDTLLNIIGDENNNHYIAIHELSYDDNTLANRTRNPNHNGNAALSIQETKFSFFLDILNAELFTIGQLCVRNTITEPEPAQQPAIEIDDANPPIAVVQPGKIEPDQLTAIKNAVDTATRKYGEWYTDGEPHRGANGFFSWARHGSYGQNRAIKFKNELSAITSDEEASDQINSLLTHDQTRYHRHSFASFLIDELKTIPMSSWSQLTYCASSNLYDKDEIIGHLTIARVIP